jgi:hypothetical protein
MTVHGNREVTGTESGLQGNGPLFFARDKKQAALADRLKISTSGNPNY